MKILDKMKKVWYYLFPRPKPKFCVGEFVRHKTFYVRDEPEFGNIIMVTSLDLDNFKFSGVSITARNQRQDLNYDEWVRFIGEFSVYQKENKDEK